MLNAGDLFADYRIDRLLGEGGMGVVYAARHPRLPRTTALKLLNRELHSDPAIRVRFEREADLVAQLEHPNIVTIYDRGIEAGHPWISMQYIDGVDATRLGIIALDAAIVIVENIAAALDHAHSRGIVHRDVKPANVLLTLTGAAIDRVFLTDFGIARLREDTSHITRTGTFTATIAYAAPEQLTGTPITAATDQYALACTLFKLLTGSAPFDAPHPGDVIRGHLQLDPPPLGSRRHGLPPALDGVLATALAKRPEHRFPTCGDFARAVRAAAGDPTHVAAEQVAAPTIKYPTHNPPPQSRPSRAPVQPVPIPNRATLSHPPIHSAYAPPGHRGPEPRRNHGRRRRIRAWAIAIVPAVAILVTGLVLGKALLNPPDDTVTRLSQNARDAYPTMVFTIRNSLSEENCYSTTETTALQRGSLKNAPISTMWTCVKHYEGKQRQYHVLVFDSAGTAQTVEEGLPLGAATLGTKPGTSFVAHHWSAPERPQATYMIAELVVSFYNDPTRSNTLVYSTDEGTSVTTDPLLAWWQSVTL